MNKRLSIFAILIFLFIQSAQADTHTSDSRHLIVDLKNYFTVPTRWDSRDWYQFGLIVSGLYITSETFDDRWKNEMVKENHPYYYKNIASIGDAWGDGRLSAPFVLGVYGYGNWTNDTRYVKASYDMLQTAVYTGLMAQVIKRIFRRNRPFQASDESSWFNNGSSFPSGHSSAAFAISRSFLNSLDKPSIGTQLLFYGLAVSTAFARTYDNVHWASDTIAGALLGVYTADYVTKQNKLYRCKYAIFPYFGTKSLGFTMRW